MKEQLIITHPGSAHFDEVTAISLIMAVHHTRKFKVERREPGITELEDPEVWVVDVGDRLEPEKLNFDHHQDANCPASFHLVAEYLGLQESISVLPWWDFKERVDRIGAERASREFSAGDDMVNKNPVETWLTDYFALETEASLDILKSFGTHIIDNARTLKRQIDYWKMSTRLTISGIPAMMGDTRESAGLEEFRRLDKNPPDIVISMDRRGEGWRLFRYEGTPVDFSRLAGLPEIEFAHKSGFMAKTRKKLPLEKLVNLVSKAVIK
jgi:hypothetical protein